jgi:hypothetical protein
LVVLGGREGGWMDDNAWMISYPRPRGVGCIDTIAQPGHRSRVDQSNPTITGKGPFSPAEWMIM